MRGGIFSGMNRQQRDPMKLNPIWILIPLLLLVAAGCGRDMAPDEIPLEITPTAAAVEPPAATTATPLPPPEAVAEATPPTAADAEYRGVSFLYRELFAEVHAESVPQALPSPGPGLGSGHPDHIRFLFVRPDEAEEFFIPRDPAIRVYPVDNFAALFPQVGDEIERLRHLLAERPPTIEGAIPFLPPLPASEVFHAQVAYLDFQNGAGVRYLTAYAQAADPLTNEDIFYTFQGVTDDGQLYVSAVFPVSIETLPGTRADVRDFTMWETGEAYEAYLDEIVAELEATAAADFEPDLDALDGIVRSLLVTTADFPAPTRMLRVTHGGVEFSYDERLGEISVETIPAQMDGLFGQDGPTVYLEGVPDYRLFIFNDFGALGRASFLVIQPLRDEAGDFYTGLPEWQQAQAEQLEAELGQVVDQETYTRPGQAHVQPVDFNSGSGIRSLVHLPSSFGPEPVTNPTLFYTFHGLTWDGRYLVWLQLAVDAPGLPDDLGDYTAEEQEQILQRYEQHLAAVMADLDEVPAAEFRPNLLLLDNLLHNLWIYE
jgi:hypothetical protein